MKSRRTLITGAVACTVILVAFAIAITQMGTLARADEHTDVTIVNGLNVTALGGLVSTLKAHPEGGRVTFFSDTKDVSPVNRSTSQANIG